MKIMNPRRRKSESGQALVLIVLGMITLLGFTALAIDGGMLYSDRRQEQNAADAASLAGGSAAAMYLENHYINYENWDCNGRVNHAMNLAESAAISRAGSNGFGLDHDLSDDNGVEATCYDGFNGSWVDKYIDVRTMITADTQTAFAHFFYNGPLRNTVEAITRVHPRMPLTYGYAIVATNTEATCNGNQNGGLFTGSILVDVHGGGIFSNGCMSGDGDGLAVNVDPGSIIHVGEYLNNHATFSPTPQQATAGPIDPSAFDVLPPDCSQVPDYNHPSTAYRNGADGLITPGNYSEIKMNGNVTLEAGGLYCLYGDFNVSNNNLTIDDSNGKHGVTIYLKSGSFITDGWGQVLLSAPPLEPDPSPAIPGVVIFLDPSNTGLVKLRGNEVSAFIGTVLAPSATIDVAGTSSSETPDEFNTQLIGSNVFIGGNASIVVNFNGDDVYTKPASLELNK
jgi:hypothetical protein